MVKTIEWQPLSDDYGIVGYAWDYHTHPRMHTES